ncbi:MAG: oxygen-dependent coproporphyrinogen oxidase [Bacteroidota bacterium]
MPNKEVIKDWFKTLQQNICEQLEGTDSPAAASAKVNKKGKFLTDTWQRPGGGGGISRVMTDGNIIEKGGVNFSEVWGKAPEPILKQLQLPEGSATDFFATGVSVVIHPYSPMVPIIHMNVRYFEIIPAEGQQATTWWFGGGIDLTPHYVKEDDARFFHTKLKEVCDRHHPTYYPEFKKWADDYFFIKHRNETRGIGGIFFDYLKAQNGFTKEDRFNFVKSVGSAFAPIYTSLMKKNQHLPYGDKEKQWQYLRRGRYVEFNLVWDRGTKFGLETDGRTESILMSLPPQAQWVYDHKPDQGSEEAKTLSLLRKGIDWLTASNK